LGSSAGHHTQQPAADEGQLETDPEMGSGEVGVSTGPLSAADEKRFQQLALTQMDFVWRCLRRLGVLEADADDALQQVLLVAHAKLQLIPEGRERAFLFATAARIAANARRAVRRREAAMEQAAIRPREPQVDQESLSEQLRARATLDDVLDELPEDLRQVFVLFEIEEVAIKDISEMLDLPIGTVGSKLRRARKAFSDAVKRYKAKQDFTVGGRP
jgi:RNA polymerase sigma-70 factor (ECF subfamily)